MTPSISLAMPRVSWRSLCFSLAFLGSATSVRAQVTSDTPSRNVARLPSSGGRRSADGRRELTAAPANGVVRIDGVLDEEVWQRAEPAAEFVQAEPLEGRPASEVTEVRVAFDADFLYVGAYLHDSDVSHWVVTDLRKDFKEDDQDDFEVLLDTFGDRRNAYVFSTNIEGAKHDRQVALEGREVNTSWDGAWDVRTSRRPDGWMAEMKIPFRALRFDREKGKLWGLNFSRHIRRKNEVVFWSPVPRAYNLNRVSLAGNLSGLETGGAGRDLRVKPYVAATTVRDRGTLATPRPGYANTVDAGADVRAAITSGLTGDLTINPDFAQVEADEQQVNLTQFSLFLPEKRDFFLENSGVFYVGDAARNNRVNPTPTPDEDNLLFFSRRIGLDDDGRAAPIAGGARLTGKLTEKLRVGVLSVQEREHGVSPSFNSTVFRVRQNLWGQGSDVGAIFMQHITTSGPSYANRVFGVDDNIRLLGRVDWNSYVVRTRAPGIDSGDYAWRSTLNYEGNFFHGKGGLMQLGSGFQNDLGYYRRTGIRKYLLETGIRPRSAWLRDHGIREFHPHVGWSYLENLDGHLVGKNLHSGWSAFFNSGAVVELSVTPNFNLLAAPLLLSPKASGPIPAGGYSWNENMLYVISDLSRPISTEFRLIWGGLYSGTQRTLNGSVTLRPTYRFKATFGLQHTSADLKVPDEPFATNLFTLRGTYSFSTRMFVDALSQYDAASKAFNANVRFNVIHHPLSDLYVVYNDQRVLTVDGPLPGRSVILKFTQMFAF